MVKQGLRSTVHLIQRFINLTRWQSACLSISPVSLFFFHFYFPKFEFLSFSTTSTGETCGTWWCLHCFPCLGYSCGPFQALVGWPTTPDAVYRSHDMFRKLQPHIHSNNSSILEVRFCFGFFIWLQKNMQGKKERKKNNYFSLFFILFFGEDMVFFFDT